MTTDPEKREVAPEINFFEGSSAVAVGRVVQRAAKNAESSAQAKAANVSRIHASAEILSTKQFTRVLNQAMTAYGAASTNRPSIRRTAPDTGGRPFHFAYSNVTKGESARGQAGRTSRPPEATGRGGTREASHQKYTENSAAIERAVNDTLALQAGLKNTQDWVLAQREESLGRIAYQSEADAQRYIENTEKVASLKGTPASFGTIGDTLEERTAFWDLVYEHESKKGGRTQTRMVLELPHEATPEQRHEMVRRFTRLLEAKGLPFWASIHAPTKENDFRNYHAHIVCTERPMKKIAHPETGETVWDFTIPVVSTKKTSGNKVIRFPHRQNRDPEMRERSFVKKMRVRWADSVNEVMASSGSPVRYDPRRYEDMGVDVEPMRNVSRIVADKLNRRSFVVMDPEWTRRLINVEMQDAAERRTEAFTRLEHAEAERKCAEAEHYRSRGWSGKLSEKHLEFPFATVKEMSAQSPSMRLLTSRRDRIADQFLEEAILSALRHVKAATSPLISGRKPLNPMIAPDPDTLAQLNEAAKEELHAYSLSCSKRLAVFRRRTTELTVFARKYATQYVQLDLSKGPDDSKGEDWYKQAAMLPATNHDDLEAEKLSEEHWKRWETTPMIVDGIAVTGLEKVWMFARNVWLENSKVPDAHQHSSIGVGPSAYSLEPAASYFIATVVETKDGAVQQAAGPILSQPDLPIADEDTKDAELARVKKKRRKAISKAKNDDRGM